MSKLFLEPTGSGCSGDTPPGESPSEHQQVTDCKKVAVTCIVTEQRMCSPITPNEVGLLLDRA